MYIAYHQRYENLDDRQIINLVLSDGNEEAMLFLIFERYLPLLKKLCMRYYGDLYYLEQLQVELFIHLKVNDWHPVRTFGWRSSFGTWLGTVAGNLFIKKMPELIGIDKFSVSVGENGEDGEVNIPEPEPPHENDMNMTILIEAIQQLKDKDLRFVLLREFDGYTPKEIARQLEAYRRKENRLKTRKVNGQIEEIIPSADYVHMLKGRAKDNIRIIISELKKEFEW